MKKILSLLCLVLLLAIAGCSNKDVTIHHYMFKGENEFWTAEYKADIKEIFTKEDGRLEYNNKETNSFKITYKNELSELKTIKNLKVSYDFGNHGGALSQNFNGPPTGKTFTMQSGSTGSALINKDDIINVIVTIDGNSQTFEMKSCNDFEIVIENLEYVFNRLFNL